MPIEPVEERDPIIEFFWTVFGRKPPDVFHLIWTLPDRQSYWFTDVEEAARWASRVQDKDVYTGVAWSPENFGASQRCKTENTAGITALWADIDIKGPAHKKTNLPADEDGAWALIRAMVLPPTAVIHSGHGLQAWWVFREPWMFADTDDRQAAASLSQRWGATLRARAQELGFDVDSTPDLARVMRAPGTVNQKAPRAPVRVILNEPKVLYDTAEFEPYLIDSRIRLISGSQQTVNGPKLTLNPQAIPPFDKWEMLKATEPRAWLSFEHKRRDMKDDSASAYDFSLAVFAATYDWSDQEITDLLIAHRRRHQADLKLRENYYMPTITRARQSVVERDSQETLENFIVERQAVRDNGEEPPMPAEDKRKEILGALSTQLKVPLIRIIKYAGIKPSYRLETGNGCLMLTDVDELINQNTFRSRLASITDRLPQRMKEGSWHTVAQSILDSLEVQELDSEATEAGLTRSWIYDYMLDRDVSDRVEESVDNLWPYSDKGRIYVFSQDLYNWLYNRRQVLSRPQMSTALRAIGCIPEMRNVVINKRRSSRGVWRLPEELTV